MNPEHSDTFVFFGATGDLAYKKIFPSLQAMVKRGRLTVPVIGVARSARDLDELRARARASLEKHGGFDAAAAAYLRGIQRRIEAGLNPRVESVASVFVSRWDGAVAGKTPEKFNNRLGIAMAERTYKIYRDMLNSDRWMRLANHGAHPQRLLWASTGTKDPRAPDDLYVKALAAPNTINTMPEATLLKFGEHGELGRILSSGGGESDETVYEMSRLGIDMEALSAKLQTEGAESFVKSWEEMMAVVAQKAQALK